MRQGSGPPRLGGAEVGNRADDRAARRIADGDRPAAGFTQPFAIDKTTVTKQRGVLEIHGHSLFCSKL